jgi:hypothetical protein
LIADIITAALLLWAALTNAAGDSPYRQEIVAAGMAVAHWESRWTPGAVGDSGCSLGAYQFNRCGGLGSAYTAEQLLDRETSSRLFYEWCAVHLAAGYDMTDILAPWSVRWEALAMAEGMEGASAWDWARLVVGDNEWTLRPPGTPGKAVEVEP